MLYLTPSLRWKAVPPLFFVPPPHTREGGGTARAFDRGILLFGSVNVPHPAKT